MYWISMHVLQPFTLLYLINLIALLNLWRSRSVLKWRLYALTASFVMLTATCSPIVAHFALGSLEWRYPPESETPDGTSAIVLLGGSLRKADYPNGAAQLAENSLVRCLHAAQTYHRGPKRMIVVCGGIVDPSIPVPLANVMRDYLVASGVDANDVLLEDSSQSTYENAIRASDLLAPKGIREIVLITEATHLYRADLCFTKAGFSVSPMGCDYRALNRLGWSIYDFLPKATAAVNVDRVAHEWLGIAWYWIHGRI